MIRFLSSANRWTLFEINEDDALASLTELHRHVFNSDPRFDADGDAATGYHFDLDEGRRGMIVSRSANPDAVRGATRLLALRYDLERVQLMARPPYGSSASVQDDDDWTLDLRERPYRLDAATVFPYEHNHRVRDTVVAESMTAPGYLHRIRADPKCIWAALAPRVEEAYEWPSAREASEWLAAHDEEPEAPWRLVWRSVALAAQDREEAAYNEEMRV